MSKKTDRLLKNGPKKQRLVTEDQFEAKSSRDDVNRFTDDQSARRKREAKRRPKLDAEFPNRKLSPGEEAELQANFEYQPEGEAYQSTDPTERDVLPKDHERNLSTGVATRHSVSDRRVDKFDFQEHEDDSPDYERVAAVQEKVARTYNPIGQPDVAEGSAMEPEDYQDDLARSFPEDVAEKIWRQTVDDEEYAAQSLRGGKHFQNWVTAKLLAEIARDVADHFEQQAREHADKVLTEISA